MNRLKDKVAFITGAAGGIGRSAAILFSKEGARVAIADVDQNGGKKTQALIQENGGQAIYVHTDVTEPESVQEAIRMVVQEFGKLDILYNNAGGSVPEDGPVTEVPIEVWKRTHSIDLFGTFLCCKYGIPELIKNKGGSVILTGSLAGLKGWKRSAYTAAKGGVISLTRILAVDYARYNIRANCICPGFVLTERTAGRVKKHPEASQSLRPMHLLGFGDPDDIAQAALFLASDESIRVTGITLSVDSGYTTVGRLDPLDLLKKN